MLNVVYLVLVMNMYSPTPTSQTIPQANMKQCLANVRMYDKKELKGATVTSNNVQIRATCVVGVMPK